MTRSALAGAMAMSAAVTIASQRGIPFRRIQLSPQPTTRLSKTICVIAIAAGECHTHVTSQFVIV
jgi:hypothetical protein